MQSFQNNRHWRHKYSNAVISHPWVDRLNQCIWHIHRSSSIIFCSLVILNGLAGVLTLPERNKLSEELRKKVASNLSTSSEEEELTREILALFDYDDESETVGNETLQIMKNETNLPIGVQNESLSLSLANLGMGTVEFNMDSVTDPKSISNLTDYSAVIALNASHEITKNTGEVGKVRAETTISSWASTESTMIERSSNTHGTEVKTHTETFEIMNEEDIQTTHILNETTNALGTSTKLVEEGNFLSSIVDNSTLMDNTVISGNTTEDVSEITRNNGSSFITIGTTMPSTTIVPGSRDNSSSATSNIGTTETTAGTTMIVVDNTTTEITTTSTITMMLPKILTTEEMQHSADIIENRKIDQISPNSIFGGNNNLIDLDQDMTQEEKITQKTNVKIKSSILELEKQIEERSEWIDGIDVSELRNYHEHLKKILINVENILIHKWPAVQMSDFTKSKRFIAISSSLPNWESVFLLNRRNALLSAASVDDAQIRKSPPHLLMSSSSIFPESSTMLITTTMAPTTTIIKADETQTVANYHRLRTTAKVTASESSGDSNEQINPRKTGFVRAESMVTSKAIPFNHMRNISLEECRNMSQAELVNELKQKGTYNPELMAWDVSGVFRFLDRSIVDQYERQSKPPKSSEQAIRRNVEALEQLLAELNLQCEVRTPQVVSRLQNLTMTEPKRSIASPSLRNREDARRKRNTKFADRLVHSFNSSERRDFADGTAHQHIRQKRKKQKLIGDVHVVPFGCDKRGYAEDGYLRLCGACQAIRKLPDEFFPPFINEVMCDEDKACLYFYDYPHGKCKQKHMNFVVLRNVGTQLCQIWEKFNLNVRVSCECFVDEMSFFAKYV